MKMTFKKIVEVMIIAVITTALSAGAATSYRLLSDIPNLVVQYTNGVITDLVDSRGQLVGLVTSTNGQTMSTIGITNGAMLCNSTAPTITSGFGASAVIANNNGSCTFQINVGATSVVSSGVIALPTARTGWNCFAAPSTASMPQVSATMLVGPTTASSVTVANFTDDTGANLNWVNNEVLAVTCSGY